MISKKFRNRYCKIEKNQQEIAFNPPKCYQKILKEKKWESNSSPKIGKF